MALPTNRIYLRSPYYVGLERPNLERILVQLFIYTGTLTVDKPSDPQYEKTATAFQNPVTGDFRADIDIADLAKDFVEVTFDGTDESNAVWIEYVLSYADVGDTDFTVQITEQLTGLYGYGTFEDGVNADPSDHVLQSANYVIVPEGQNAIVPTLQDNLTGWKLYDSTNIGQSPSGLIESFTFGGTAEETSEVIQYITSATALGTPNTIVLEFSGGITDKTLRIIYENADRYDSIKVSFVNRFGAVQHLHCFAKNQVSLSTTETQYKRELLEGGTYDTKRHQYNTLEKNGKLSITVNTGHYPQDIAGTIAELMKSETVWATVPAALLDFNAFNPTLQVVAPVRVRNQRQVFQTYVTEGLINYSFDLEFASDRISTV